VSGWDNSPPPPAKPPTAYAAPAITGSQGDGQVSPAEMARRAARQTGQVPSDAIPAPAPKPEPKKEEKKGILRRIFGVFK